MSASSRYFPSWVPLPRRRALSPSGSDGRRLPGPLPLVRQRGRATHDSPIKGHSSGVSARRSLPASREGVGGGNEALDHLPAPRFVRRVHQVQRRRRPRGRELPWCPEQVAEVQDALHEDPGDPREPSDIAQHLALGQPRPMAPVIAGGSPSVPRGGSPGARPLAPWLRVSPPGDPCRMAVDGACDDHLVGLRTRIVDDGSVSGHHVRLGRVVRLALGLSAVALGVLAEWQGGPWPSPSALVDLAAGWVVIGFGLIAWSRRPGSRVGPLIVITGFAWFLGTLAGSDIGLLATVGGLSLTIHRAPLLHAIIGYPTGRALGRMNLALVIAGYAYAVVVPLARDGAVTIIISMALLTTTLWTYLRSTGPQRQARRVAVVAAGVFAMPLLTGSLGRLAGAGPDLEGALNWIYPAAVALVGIILATDLSRARWAQAEVTRLVVDLGDPPRAGIRGRLAEALADPSLELAYWLPESGGYVDETGRPIHVPAAGSGRAVTVLDQDGERVGALVHDHAVFDDPVLLQAVAAAAQMALANVRLQAEIRRHLDDLEASRRRLLETSDAQSRRLELRLRQGVGRQLSDLGEVLERARADQRPSGKVAVEALLTEAERELKEAQHDLERLATGVRPPVLSELGVGAALSALAERIGIPVRLSVPAGRLPERVETAVYFICSEAVANVQKHADASGVELEVRVEGGSVVVVVADDGVGGADPSAGSGLDGLRDRTEALGGSFTIESPPGHGTRITAAIPVDAGDVPETRQRSQPGSVSR